MFSMGNEKLGLKYENEDGKPVCVIYEEGQIAAKVPVVLPPFIFEVHNSKLFWHDIGSGDWLETNRFWGFSTEYPEALTDWKAAVLIARIEGSLTLTDRVPVRCRKCKFISIVGDQSNCAHREKCILCIKS
jgi:hypothetical protein